MFTFLLLDESGREIGTYATSEPSWKPGHQVYVGSDTYVVVEVRQGVLVVKPQ